MPKLHYVTPHEAGINRKKVGKHFHYFTENNKEIINEKTLQRILSLTIPPKYKNVWICKSSNGHIQAYGYDQLDRKQYIYHPQWIKKREKSKFDHLIEFGLSLPILRKQVFQDLKKSQLTKNVMLAVVIKLLDTTCIRIGSPQYESFGLLTLKKSHMKLRKNKVVLDFLGKSKQQWHLEIPDKKIFSIFTSLHKQKGSKVFDFEDSEGVKYKLKANDVNMYLKQITGREITAKEFRTWQATAFFLSLILKNKSKYSDEKLKAFITKTAKFIWNTPAVCKSSYIHPLMMKLFLNGGFQQNSRFKKHKWLTENENLLLYLLEQHK